MSDLDREKEYDERTFTEEQNTKVSGETKRYLLNDPLLRRQIFTLYWMMYSSFVVILILFYIAFRTRSTNIIPFTVVCITYLLPMIVSGILQIRLSCIKTIYCISGLFNLFRALDYLTDHGCLVVLPVGSDAYLKSVVDECVLIEQGGRY